MVRRTVGRPRKNTIGIANDFGNVSGNAGAESVGESIAAVDDPAADGNIDGAGSDIDSSVTEFIDPGTVSGNSDGGDAPKRRGRKPGSRNKPRSGSSSQATDDISRILFTLHLFVSNIVRNEMLAITKEESEQLGSAITRVTELYEVPLMNEKHMAILNLAMVAGGIYGTRFIAINMQKSKDKKNVVDMPSPFTQTGTN